MSCSSTGSCEIGESADDEVTQLLDDESLKIEESKEKIPVKPWKLRKRSETCSEPISEISQLTLVKSTLDEEQETKRIEIEENDNKVVKANTTKPSVSLTKKEIEDDFMAMVGHKPPRRPKKRPRDVQENLDKVFPGLNMNKWKAEDYEVTDEAKENYESESSDD